MSFKTRMEDPVRHADHQGAESEPGDGGEHFSGGSRLCDLQQTISDGDDPSYISDPVISKRKFYH